ncbi:MAG: uL30 family ribosomal protein [Candidatus Pacearchaeota archaeon]|nr:uL30 family ribosomal protein [Candidatus Pacearchaeota archaeon]
MIIAIRISGMVGVSRKVEDTLFRLRLRRKYSAVILEENTKNEKLLRTLRDFTAFGRISEENLVKLIELRGQKLSSSKDMKINSKKIASELGKKNLEDFGLKKFFRLHPPRKGIESKKHFGVGKGVLGDNKDKINDLLERML